MFCSTYKYNQICVSKISKIVTVYFSFFRDHVNGSKIKFLLKLYALWFELYIILCYL